MAVYRIVYFDSRGRVSAMDDIDMPNDEAALAAGAARGNAQPAVEIWQLERMVGRLGSPLARPVNRPVPDFVSPAARRTGFGGGAGPVRPAQDARGSPPRS